MNDFANELRLHISRMLAKLPPTKGGQGVLMALLAGGLAGAVGCGLYLKSWRDGVAMAVLLFVLHLLFPHLPLFALGALSGSWTAMRAIQAGCATNAVPERAVFVDVAAAPASTPAPIPAPAVPLFDGQVGVKVLRG